MFGSRMIYIVLGVFAVGLVYFGWKLTARGAYESAQYTIVEAEGPFQLREYSDLMLVTTKMQFESQGDDGSFMRLFGYISGGNDSKQNVAMTTPVFMEPEEDDSQGQMSFVIPKAVADERVPEPASDGVALQKRTGGRFAVIRFAGRVSKTTSAQAESKLRDWIKDKGLVIGDGQVEIAGYDPPWTPGPMRRNEALIRMK